MFPLFINRAPALEDFTVQQAGTALQVIIANIDINGNRAAVMNSILNTGNIDNWRGFVYRKSQVAGRRVVIFINCVNIWLILGIPLLGTGPTDATNKTGFGKKNLE